MKLVSTIILLLGCASTVNATAVYTYTGNPYTSTTNFGTDLNTGEPIPHSEPFDTSMNLTVELVFEQELTWGQHEQDDLVSFSFFDGIDTITGAPGDGGNYELGYFVLDVNASGEIEYWAISVQHHTAGESSTFVQYMSTGHGPETYPFNSLSTVQPGDYTEKWESGPGRSAETTWGGPDSPQGTWAATVVPIPAAAWLFGSALAGLGCIRRKQAA